MAGLGVHRRYDPPRHHTARYAPPARHLGVGLDVLAGHHRQQRRRLGLLLCELRAVERVEHPLGVGDQIIYEPRPLVGVVPVTHRPGPSVVVMAQHQPSRRRRQAAHTPNLRADHRDGVLGRDRVEQHRGVQRPHRLVRQRTASKIRSGHPLARSLWRHSVNTLASKPPSSMPSPAAAFQRTSQRSRSSASRSEHPSSACRTITTAITDPGTDGRPRGPKRSSNNPSGNNLRRFSAKNRCTDPSRTRPPHKPKVSNSSRSSFSVPCIPHDPTPHTRSRAPRPELLSTLLGGWCQMGLAGPVSGVGAWWRGTVLFVVGGAFGRRAGFEGFAGRGCRGWRRGSGGWGGVVVRRWPISGAGSAAPARRGAPG